MGRSLATSISFAAGAIASTKPTFKIEDSRWMDQQFSSKIAQRRYRALTTSNAQLTAVL